MSGRRERTLLLETAGDVRGLRWWVALDPETFGRVSYVERLKRGPGVVTLRLPGGSGALAVSTGLKNRGRASAHVARYLVAVWLSGELGRQGPAFAPGLRPRGSRTSSRHRHVRECLRVIGGFWRNRAGLRGDLLAAQLSSRA